MTETNITRKQVGVVIKPGLDTSEQFVVVEIIIHNPMPENDARLTLKQTGLRDADVEHRIHLARYYPEWARFGAEGVS